MNYNEIGISNEVDYIRIRKLLCIGLFAAVLTFASDWILGYGVSNPSLNGIEKMLSVYIHRTDTQIFLSSFLGFVGIPLEGLCYFAIYRLMAKKSSRLAHWYRSGIFGYLMFGGCGVHVFCLAALYLYKNMLQVSPETALDVSMKFGLYFMLPSFVMFAVFFMILCISQMIAFLKEKTPYPRWCAVFNILVPMFLSLLLEFLPESAVRNALSSAWISMGNVWMFAGLLLTMKFAEGYRKQIKNHIG